MVLHAKWILPALVSMLLSVNSQAQNWSISASSIERLGASLSSVSPAVSSPSNAADYLSENSALGYNGPLGPYGPLSSLGPVGSNVWSSSYWISAFGSWSQWSNDYSDLNGPLSEDGPLGPYGPLSDLAYDVDLPAINDFSKQLQAGGVWTALGPVGPLGVLGPLGPLGPVGAHGYESNVDGQYLNAGEEIRQISINYDGGLRSYELYENYSEEYAASSENNDTSFMLEGYVAWPYIETDTFEFISGSEQSVTIVLSPVFSLDDFDLVISDASGQVIAVSNTYNYIDFIQLNNIAAGTKLTAKVSLYSSYHSLFKGYRLFVTGSGEYVSSAVPISGDHQVLR